MKEGNPLLALERGEVLDLPPVLIIQGTADRNVPLAAVDRFADSYRAAGGAADIEWFPDMPLRFACKAGAETDSVLKIIEAFIRRQLKGDKKA